MRHSIWVTHSGIATPVNTEGLTRDPNHSESGSDSLPAAAPDAVHASESVREPSTESTAAFAPVRASTRLWTRSLLAFLALVLLLAALIELVASLVTGSSLTMPFGVAAACIAIAIVSTLALTRERRR